MRIQGKTQQFQRVKKYGLILGSILGACMIYSSIPAGGLTHDLTQSEAVEVKAELEKYRTRSQILQTAVEAAYNAHMDANTTAEDRELREKARIEWDNANKEFIEQNSSEEGKEVKDIFDDRIKYYVEFNTKLEGIIGDLGGEVPPEESA